MNYDEAFHRVIGHEGGLTLDRNDRGNWTSGVIGKGELKGTKYGVSAMAYPNEDIQNLTLDRAKEIYRRDYWNKCHIDELPDDVRFDMFDTAINSGVAAAIKIMQRALNVGDDGVWGPKTSAAAKAAAASPAYLDKRFNGFRLRYLCDIPTFNNFGRGWVRRVASNLIDD